MNGIQRGRVLQVDVAGGSSRRSPGNQIGIRRRRDQRRDEDLSPRADADVVPPRRFAPLCRRSPSRSSLLANRGRRLIFWPCSRTKLPARPRLAPPTAMIQNGCSARRHAERPATVVVMKEQQARSRSSSLRPPMRHGRKVSEPMRPLTSPGSATREKSWVRRVRESGLGQHLARLSQMKPDGDKTMFPRRERPPEFRLANALPGSCSARLPA